MTILDAFAVLALLKGEPAAAQVQRLVNGGGVALTAVGAAEVLDHLVRVVGISDEEAALDLAQLGMDDPIVVDGRVGQMAGLLRAEHHHRIRRAAGLAVSMADCVAVASAALFQRALATSDPDLLDLCADVGVSVIPLANSSGVVWQGP